MNRTRTSALGVALAAILAVLPLSPDPTGAEPAAAAPAEIPSVGGDWAEPGPYSVTAEAAGSTHTIYRPTNLGQDGVVHPVILWGNGTFAWPQIYDGLLRHLASHGFVVAAANTAWAGSGQEMLAGASYLSDENSRPGSPYYRKIDVDNIGATGHSQGGGGAIAAGADPRVDTTVPIQPGPQGAVDSLHGSTFMLAGQSDAIVWPWLLVIPRYNDADHIPAIYGELSGAGHFEPLNDGGGFRGMITAWFRYWLMDDQEAKSEFFGSEPGCGICNDNTWSDVRRNALTEAV
jgi:hypothetical protein